MNWFKKLKIWNCLSDPIQYSSDGITHLANSQGINWFKTMLRKSAGRNLTDVLDVQIQQFATFLRQNQGSYAGVQFQVKRLEQALNSLRHSRYLNDEEKESQKRAEAKEELRKAYEFANLNGLLNNNDPLSRNISETVNQGGQWHQKTFVDSVSLVNVPQLNQSTGPDNWIKISGLQLHPLVGQQKNPTATWLESQMGDAIFTETQDVFVRGTKEAWGKFLVLSTWLVYNTQELASSVNLSSLPSEKEFVDDYVADEKNRSAAAPLPMNVVPLNVSEGDFANTSQSTYEVGASAKSPPQGIRLYFDPSNEFFREDFPEIRDMIITVGNIEPRMVRTDWNNGIIDIFDIKPGDKLKAAYLYAVGRSLESKFKYDNVPIFNNIVQSLVGVSRGNAEAHKNLVRPDMPSPRVVSNRIAKNMYDGPRISSRFSEIKQSLGIQDGEIEVEQLQKVIQAAYPGNVADPNAPYGPNNWEGPFGPSTTPSQRLSQSEAIRFSTSRGASVLADEPGSGKTCSAIISADLSREDGEKILVFSPNMLLDENWTGENAKGPTYFCGHDRSQIAEIHDAQSLQAALDDPNVIWVVMGFSKLGAGNRKTEDLQTALREACFNGRFSSFVMDEIQTIKDLDKVTGKKINKSIPKGTVYHRIGMTGTPSDNKPSDVYSQLVFLSHPVLYSDKGRAQKSVAMDFKNAKMFADQYLGGSELANDVKLEREEKELSPEIQADILSEKWEKKAYNVLKWVGDLDTEHKKVTLELFAKTYLRRDKEDIRPEIAEEAPLTRSPQFIDVPDGLEIPQDGQNWHNKALGLMAKAKVPHTVAKALDYLNQDPNQHIFIVTKHPSIADQITQQINNQVGHPVAQAVHGKTKGDARSEIADSFKDKSSGLRVAVYSMKLGAVGLNFDVATKAIFNDMDWNPSNNLQAEYRVHRIQSSQPVSIDYMVLNSGYDKEMFDRIMRKREINETLINIMREARNARSDGEYLDLSNKFIRNVIDNIIINAGMNSSLQEWFETQMEAALQGKPIASYSEVQEHKRREKRKNPLENYLPDWLKNDEEFQKQNWVSSMQPYFDKLVEEKGEDWIAKQDTEDVVDMMDEIRLQQKDTSPESAPKAAPAARRKAKPRSLSDISG